MVNPVLLCPLRYGLRFPKCGHANAPRSVVVLNFAQRPEAIILGVSKVIVDSLYGVLRGWPNTNIGVELFERLPRGVVRNTSASVAGVSSVAWVIATLLHGLPRFVLWGLVHAVCRVAVVCTTARGCFLYSEATDEHLLSAVAQAVPNAVSVSI